MFSYGALAILAVLIGANAQTQSCSKQMEMEHRCMFTIETSPEVQMVKDRMKQAFKTCAPDYPADCHAEWDAAHECGVSIAKNADTDPDFIESKSKSQPAVDECFVQNPPNVKEGIAEIMMKKPGHKMHKKKSHHKRHHNATSSGSGESGESGEMHSAESSASAEKSGSASNETSGSMERGHHGKGGHGKHGKGGHGKHHKCRPQRHHKRHHGANNGSSSASSESKGNSSSASHSKESKKGGVSSAESKSNSTSASHSKESKKGGKSSNSSGDKSGGKRHGGKSSNGGKSGGHSGGKRHGGKSGGKSGSHEKHGMRNTRPECRKTKEQRKCVEVEMKNLGKDSAFVDVINTLVHQKQKCKSLVSWSCTTKCPKIKKCVFKASKPCREAFMGKMKTCLQQKGFTLPPHMMKEHHQHQHAFTTPLPVLEQ